MSDEFSSHPLNRSWIWDNPGKNATYSINKGRLYFTVAEDSNLAPNVNKAPKMLREPMKGDWLVDTHYTETTEKVGSPSHAGIIIYADADNWLMWGVCGNNSMKACGMHLESSDGQVGNSNAKGEAAAFDIELANIQKYEFFRIRKRTNDSAFTRYYFYYSSDRMSWYSAGYWEDVNNILKDANIGLAARTWGEGYTVAFDYFTEYIPVNDIDEFNGNTLDSIWTWKADCSEYSFTGCTLAEGDLIINVGDVNNSNSDKDFAALLLRKQICSFAREWMIDTHIKQNEDSRAGIHGLVVYYDTDNWIHWGHYEDGAMKLQVVLDGNTKYFSNQTNYQHARLRISKKNDRYSFESSNNGIDWEPFAHYVDREKRFSNASYGIGCRYSEIGRYEVKYAFFRERYLPNGVLQEVTELTKVNMITGPEALNDTTNVDLHGTDLGSITEMDGKHYFVFGDSFSAELKNWRSNVMGYTDVKSPSIGIQLNWITGDDGNAKEVIPSLKAFDFNEHTCIPTNGVSYDGVLYYSYMNVYHWGPAAHWDCGFSEWCISKDQGHTWTKTSSGWGPGSNFIQLGCVKDNTTLYVYGIPSSRFGGVKLAKVPISQLLNMGAYKYYAGNDSAGEPIWSIYEKDAEVVVPGPVGEFSVIFNPFLGKWIMTYLNEHTLDLEIRESDSPWGEWSPIPLVLVDHTVSGYDKLIYAPFMSPEYMDRQGEILYFTMSQWMPVYNVAWMKARLVKN